MYIAISIIWENGFDNRVNVMTFSKKEEAIKETALIREYWERHFAECDSTIYENDETNFRADENNNKGEGFELHIISEEDVMDKIMRAVDSSTQTRDIKQIEVDGTYDIKAKCIELPTLPYTAWDAHDCNDGFYYQPLRIVARPYRDADNEEDTIYDVYMNRVEDEVMIDPDKRVDDHAILFIDSLENIGYDILANIYMHL